MTDPSAGRDSSQVIPRDFPDPAEAAAAFDAAPVPLALALVVALVLLELLPLPQAATVAKATPATAVVMRLFIGSSFLSVNRG
ncbi:MAG: hypothetical protein QOJ11_2977 [Frankiales bacterium]|jgi:hypothetical protein|nr:hypothetical protein [Frankiales bacterium]